MCTPSGMITFNSEQHPRTECPQACTSRMNLGEEVDLEDYVGRPDKINNAEIMSICQEAGMQAVRKNRYAAAY